MNKLITKFKLNRTANARKWKHKDGGILKCLKGSPWLSREEQAYNDKLMSKKGSFMVDSIYNRHIDPIKGAGVAGSMALESSFNPNARGGSHLGYVLNEPRIVNYIKRNYGGYDHNAQVRFLLDGLTKGLPDSTSVMGRDLLTRFNNYNWKTYKTPEEAARAWEKSYEKSGGLGNNQRLYYSRMFYNLINNKLRGHKKGGSLSKKSKGAFVPGVDITDYNPKAYKYVKKKYGVKKNLYGGYIPDGINYLLNSGSAITHTGNIVESYMNYYSPQAVARRELEKEQKEKLELELKLNEMLLQLEKINSILGFIGNYAPTVLSLFNKKDNSSKLFTNTTGYDTVPISTQYTVPQLNSNLKI